MKTKFFLKILFDIKMLFLNNKFKVQVFCLLVLINGLIDFGQSPNHLKPVNSFHLCSVSGQYKIVFLNNNLKKVFCLHVLINNGNRTEWSPILSVII